MLEEYLNPSKMYMIGCDFILYSYAKLPMTNTSV
jgi:hypothetical protein